MFRVTRSNRDMTHFQYISIGIEHFSRRFSQLQLLECEKLTNPNSHRQPNPNTKINVKNLSVYNTV